MGITEKDLYRYYAAKLMESFRNVFGFKDEKFEPHSEDIEKETKEGKRRAKNNIHCITTTAR